MAGGWWLSVDMSPVPSLDALYRLLTRVVRGAWWQVRLELQRWWTTAMGARHDADQMHAEVELNL